MDSRVRNNSMGASLAIHTECSKETYTSSEFHGFTVAVNIESIRQNTGLIDEDLVTINEATN
jgi:hypothetical protein